MNRKSVLFVCLGNICRSPLAEGVMREAAELRGIEVRIDSAGTGDWHVGSEPDRRAQAVAALAHHQKARQPRLEQHRTIGKGLLQVVQQLQQCPLRQRIRKQNLCRRNAPM